MFTWVLKCIVDLFFAIWPQPKPSADASKDLKVIAHRGVHEKDVATENTLAAFELAKQHRLWGIEFDVRWTQDNTPVVHHDENTKRVFNKNLSIANVSFHELRSQVPEVPSLSEVLQKYSGQLHLMIELKTNITSEQNAVLLQLLAELVAGKDYHLLSLDTDFFATLQGFPPECFLPVAVFDVKEKSQWALSGRYAGLAGHFYLLSDELLSKHHGQKQMLGTGYIRSKNSLYREINRGTDWIFTDHAITLSNIRQKIPL